MANEQLQKYLKAIKKNKETSAIVVIGVLLALVGFIYLQESNRVQVEIPLVPAGQLDEVLTEENTSAAALFEFDSDIHSDGRFTHLVNFGLFTLRSQQETQQLRQQAEQRLSEAQAAFDRQEYEVARAICEEILTEIFPPHTATQELLSVIDELLAEAAPETPTADAEAFAPPPGVPGDAQPGVPPPGVPGVPQPGVPQPGVPGAAQPGVPGAAPDGGGVDEGFGAEPGLF